MPVPSSVSVQTSSKTQCEVVPYSVQVFWRGTREIQQLVQVGGNGGRVLGVFGVQSVHQPLIARLTAAVTAAGHDEHSACI